MLCVAQWVQVGIAFAAFSVPNLVEHAAAVRIVLNDRVVPVSDPHVFVWPEISKYRSNPVVCAGKQVVVGACFFLEKGAVWFEIGCVDDVACGLPNHQCPPVLFWVMPAGIREGARSSSVAIPVVYLLQRAR